MDQSQRDALIEEYFVRSKGEVCHRYAVAEHDNLDDSSEVEDRIILIFNSKDDAEMCKDHLYNAVNVVRPGKIPHFTYLVIEVPVGTLSEEEPEPQPEASQTVDAAGRTGPERDTDRHCSCGYLDNDDMVICDNEDCEHVYFHYECVGFEEEEANAEEEWFCSASCEENAKKRTKRKTKTKVNTEPKAKENKRK